MNVRFLLRNSAFILKMKADRPRRSPDTPDMEKYIQIKIGQTVTGVEKIINRKIKLEEFKNDHVSYYFTKLEDIGVWLFFNIDNMKLYTIRYESPFSLEINNVKINMTKKDVIKIKGKPNRKHPLPELKNDIWYYDQEKLRLDFEEGKLINIFK